MSFILDALRKSETERQRQAGPGLVDAGHRPPARRRNPWLVLLVAVLAANLALMAWYWQRDPRPPPAAAPGAVVAAPPAPAVAVAPPPVGRSLAEAAGAEQAATDYAASADLPAVEAAPFTETLEPPAVDAARAEPASVIREGLPTAAQLVAGGALAGPALHLDIHVYSADPAGRFVFVNMRKYTEGMQLPDGPRLEEIIPEGAIFSHDGQRFLLPRD